MRGYSIKFSKKPAMAMCVLILMQFITMLLAVQQTGQKQQKLGVLLVFLFLLLLVADCLLVNTVIKNSKSDHISRKVRFMEKQEQLEISCRKDLEIWNTERKDMKRFLMERLLEAQFYLSEGNYLLLDEMQQRLDQTKELHYCDHILSNVILAEKEKLAAKDEISIEIQAALPSKLPIEESELCSIWCNLLDNAIEACRKLPDPSKRKIRVSTAVQGGYLYIKVENSMVASNRKLTYHTGKNNPMAHGYGLRIVKELARKYKGEVFLKQEGCRHTVIVTAAVECKEGGALA